MHGTYRHRITCNLHPHQYYPIVQAAQKYKMPKALLLRDAALAYLQKKTVLPPGIDERLKSIQQEVENIDRFLKPIIAQADALKRLTPQDIRRAAKTVSHLDRQLIDLLNILTTIPHDH